MKIMTKIKDIPKFDRPREKYVKKGADSLSNTDLLSILLGSGIKGKNVKQLSESILKKFGKNFLNVTPDDLLEIPGIGQAKALQITSAISLVKRFYEDDKKNGATIRNAQDVVNLTYDLGVRKKEYLVCLYLNARNSILRKETVSIGLLDKTLIHPREIFYPAVELNASGVILVHNHPTGETSPSSRDSQVVRKIVQAGEIMGIPIIDFIIVSKNDHYSFYKELRKQINGYEYLSEGIQGTLFPQLEIEKPAYEIQAEKIQEDLFYIPKLKENYFQLHNRRYIGNKFKLIDWIFSIIKKECDGNSFADIFAGTGVISALAMKHYEKIFVNDFLYSNFAIYKAFFGNEVWDKEKINNIIRRYNNICSSDLEENYFSKNFGGKFFSYNSAKLIGFIRENIEENRMNLSQREYFILIASLIYSADKIANTVGHFDAYFKKENVNDSFFIKPIDPFVTDKISIFQDDANELVKRIESDIVYIDPPYNSRQYSRFYHVHETLTKWDKPKLHGVALKPDAENMSDYCRNNAKQKFEELVKDIKARFLVVSYNNTYESKSNSSKNKIALHEIEKILKAKGKTKVFEKDYRHFNAGNTNFKNHKEYLFVTKTNHD